MALISVMFCLHDFGLNPTRRTVLYIYICSAQSRNRYNSRIVLRKVGILTLLRKVGILTLRKTILELLPRKVGIGTKWKSLLLYEVGIETKLEYRIYCNLFQVIVFDVLPTYAV